MAPPARVKRCGKSAPRPWQQGWQGKPHREQDRIGAAGGRETVDAGAFPPCRPGWSREVRCETHRRGMVVAVLRKRCRTEPGLQAVWHLSTIFVYAARAAKRLTPLAFTQGSGHGAEQWGKNLPQWGKFP